MSNESQGAELREIALTLDPASIGLSPIDGPVWGFIMDSTFSDSTDWFSVVAFADGSTSLYTSGKFAIIGGGAHESVRTANAELLQAVDGAIANFASSASWDLPRSGYVTLRALTFDGSKAITIREAELHDESRPEGQIYAAAHNVKAVLRSLPEVGI